MSAESLIAMSSLVIDVFMQSWQNVKLINNGDVISINTFFFIKNNKIISCVLKKINSCSCTPYIGTTKNFKKTYCNLLK